MLEFLTIYLVFALATASISIPLIYRKVDLQLRDSVSFIDTMGRTQFYVIMWVFSFLLAPVIFYLLARGEKTRTKMVNSLVDQMKDA